MIAAPACAQPTVALQTPPASHVRLLAAIESELHASGYGPLREIDCHVHEDLVILAGHVPSFYMKQIAQIVVMKIDEVDAIENRLRVEN